MTQKNRGLGRGLNALFEDEEGENFSSSASNTDSVQGRKIVGIADIIPNQDQPRRHFDAQALKELADSIREHGIIQPLLVRPYDGPEAKYEIVAGERRWRASQIAQLHELPVVVREMDDGQMLQIALIENLQREDLNPIEEAKCYERLMEEFGYNQENLAESVGKSRSYIANVTRILNLPDSVQSMIADGSLSLGHAKALLGAKNPSLLAQEIVSEKLSVREAEKRAAQDVGRTPKNKSGNNTGSSAKDPNMAALEGQLSEALGLNVRLDMKTQHAGAVKIEFKNLDQLDDILQRLTRPL